MKNISYNYDKEGDILYLSFAQSKRVTTVELSEHLLLRLDIEDAPRAIGLTVLFPAQLLRLGYRPMQLDLKRLRELPTNFQTVVLEALTTPPVSELLSAELTFTANVPPLPQMLAARAA